jgi:hypothetical protein
MEERIVWDDHAFACPCIEALCLMALGVRE